MTTATDLRRHLHDMWDGVAEAWADHADFVDNRGRAITATLLDRTAPRPGERVLELACGAGGTGLAAASLVAPGEVVLSDVSPAMTAVAAARAAAVSNVDVGVLDLEEIAEPDGAYDVVLCREGLMFAVDPARAVAEIHRVLRPGGRVGLAVWGPRAENPWLATMFDTVSAQLGAPVPPPGIPGPFALEDASRLAGLLAEAGFEGVLVTSVSVPLRDVSFEAWRSRTSALAGPLAQRLAALPEPAAQALRARLREAVRPFETDGALEFPGLSLIASGRKLD
jgi:ubiquinone/menaquinone biosynthesis C-methylase UbiE